MKLKDFLIHYFEELLRFFSVLLLTGLLIVFDNLIQRQPIGYEYFIIGIGQTRYLLFFMLSVALVQHARNKAQRIFEQVNHRLYLDVLIATLVTVLSTAYFNELNVGVPTLFTLHSGGVLGYSINTTLSEYPFHPLFFFMGTLLVMVFSNISFVKIAEVFWDIIEMLMLYVSESMGFKNDNHTANIPLHFDTFHHEGRNIIQATEIEEMVIDAPIALSSSRDPLIVNLQKALDAMKLKGIQIMDNVKKGSVVSTLEIRLPDTMSVEILDRKGLLNDLTRRLKVESLRLVYMIKGTDSIFIEVPNDTFKLIPWKKTLQRAIQFYNVSDMNLPILLGVDTIDNPMLFDLSTFPHFLVAGTTQSGKTVGIHSMICSLIALDANVKFILVDPKLNEFIHYENSSYVMNVNKPFEMYPMAIDDLKSDIIKRIRQFDSIAYGTDNDRPLSTIGDNEDANTIPVVDDDTPYFKGYESFQVENGIVTDMDIVSDILLRLTVLMDVRAARLAVLKSPNIVDYNKKHRELNGVFYKEGVGYSFEAMDYVVVVVDELADLMSQYSKWVEPSIKRLAQKARSVGIHLILATQRPSIDVITGVIKANLPARLSYRLPTAIDSKTVNIDGAQLLLGRGDCLMSNDLLTNKRMHSAFIDTTQIATIVAGNFDLQSEEE